MCIKLFQWIYTFVLMCIEEFKMIYKTIYDTPYKFNFKIHFIIKSYGLDDKNNEKSIILNKIFEKIE